MRREGCGCWVATDSDSIFGEALDPQGGLKPWEEVDASIKVDVEVHQLSIMTAGYLARLCDLANSSPTNAKILQGLTFLWAVDPTNRILFALEETLILEPAETQRPRLRGVPIHDSVKPLGHPLLLNRGKGRIAGELYLDKEEGLWIWMINNRSGRYGLHKSRTEEHLKNVQKQFETCGLMVQQDFIRLG